jgi:hypothetical protein
MKFMVKAAALTVILIKNAAHSPARHAFSSDIRNLAGGYGCFEANGKISAEVGKLVSQMIK